MHFIEDVHGTFLVAGLVGILLVVVSRLRRERQPHLLFVALVVSIDFTYWAVMGLLGRLFGWHTMFI